MSQITNKDVVKALFDGARMPIQETPAELGKTVVPVLDGTPDFHRITDKFADFVVSVTTTGSTITTTPTTRDFYLTGAQIAFQADATADSTNVQVTFVQGGVRRVLYYFPKLSLTATSDSIFLNFQDKPIKIDRGTTILGIQAFTVGASKLSVQIFGYEVDIN